MTKWWKLTNEEAERLNPPPEVHALGDDDNWYTLQVDYPDWQPVGHIPRPRTRLGWFVYHIIHGLYMRYPWWKVIGFALASNRMGPDIYVDLDDWDKLSAETWTLEPFALCPEAVPSTARSENTE